MIGSAETWQPRLSAVMTLLERNECAARLPLPGEGSNLALADAEPADDQLTVFYSDLSHQRRMRNVSAPHKAFISP
jgi:hypothetical protein